MKKRVTGARLEGFFLSVVLCLPFRFVVALLGTLLAWNASAGGDVAVDVRFCEFPMPPEAIRADVNFPVVCSFETDSAGHPRLIEKVASRFVNDEDVKSCVQEWTLRTERPSARWTARFQWRYGTGWESLELSRPGERIILRPSGVPKHDGVEREIEK